MQLTSLLTNSSKVAEGELKEKELAAAKSEKERAIAAMQREQLEEFKVNCL